MKNFYVIVLFINLFLLAALVAAISRPGMNEIWLAGVSGIILVTLLALQVALNIHLALGSKEHRSGGPLAAAWAVCFFIYMAYALLPIRLRHACIAGFIFSVAHLIGAFTLYPAHYPAMMEHVSAITDVHKLCFCVRHSLRRLFFEVF